MPTIRSATQTDVPVLHALILELAAFDETAIWFYESLGATVLGDWVPVRLALAGDDAGGFGNPKLDEFSV